MLNLKQKKVIKFFQVFNFIYSGFKMDYENIIKFWFDDIDQKKWFEKDDNFDELLKNKFSTHVELALDNNLDHWKSDIKGYLALILLLDQFTRNIYRNSPKAFVGDKKALNLSLIGVGQGFLNNDNLSWRHFLLMPMMHSETLAVQEMSLPLFKKYTNEKTYDFAKRHYDIIKDFGRFPHRNKILGRDSTKEEIQFLTQPGSSF